MQLRFTKDLINDIITTDVKISDQLRLYKIFDEHDAVLGQFFFHHTEQYLIFANKEIVVETTSRILKKSQHLLIDKSDGKQIGQYELYKTGLATSEYFIFNQFLIKIGDKTYILERQKPEAKRNFFKMETWGHFKFRLYPKTGGEYAEYSLKMDIPSLSKINYTKYRHFTGTIEANMTDVFPILSAFYLFEIEFDNEDAKYSD
ncbi:MAG: hypothetical protein J7621_01885 [Niastella sp.]|nr:hypothetical protein [Niastella sp.]